MEKCLNTLEILKQEAICCQTARLDLANDEILMKGM